MKVCTSLLAGVHIPRCGANSRVSTLDSDTVRHIIDYVKPKHMDMETYICYYSDSRKLEVLLSILQETKIWPPYPYPGWIDKSYDYYTIGGKNHPKIDAYQVFMQILGDKNLKRRFISAMMSFLERQRNMGNMTNYNLDAIVKAAVEENREKLCRLVLRYIDTHEFYDY